MADTGSTITRILVALDADAPNRAAIEAAVRLAEEYQAELVGLFVTESDMLTLSSLPGARHLIGHTLTAQTLEPGAIERAMRILAERARADLAAMAERRHVRWSFRSISGTASEAVVTEAEGFDVVAFGRGTRRRRSMAHATKTRCGIMLATPEARAGRPVVLWSNGNGAALGVALRLARSARVKLLVLLPAGAEPARAAEIAQQIAAAGIPGEVRPLSLDTPGAAFREMRLAHPGLLVISRTSPLTEHEDFESFVDSLDCSVFLSS